METPRRPGQDRIAGTLRDERASTQDYLQSAESRKLEAAERRLREQEEELRRLRAASAAAPPEVGSSSTSKNSGWSEEELRAAVAASLREAGFPIPAAGEGPVATAGDRRSQEKKPLESRRGDPRTSYQRGRGEGEKHWRRSPGEDRPPPRRGGGNDTEEEDDDDRRPRRPSRRDVSPSQERKVKKKKSHKDKDRRRDETPARQEK